MISSTISVTLFVVATLSTLAGKISLYRSINFIFHRTKYLSLFSFSLQTETRSEESLVMRVFNPDYHPSDDEMLAVLKKADLESHGYTKELTTALTSKPSTTNPTYEKKHLYYKTVDCSRVQEVVQELETLLPGNSIFFQWSVKRI